MMALKLIPTGRHFAIGALCICVLAGAFLVFAQSRSNGRIIAYCESAAPRTLNEIASARLRRSYSGIGWIHPSSKGSIPYAVFELDGVDLLWTGFELERRDYPMQGFTTRWVFTDGDKVFREPKVRGDSAEMLSQLIELLGQQ